MTYPNSKYAPIGQNLWPNQLVPQWNLNFALSQWVVEGFSKNPYSNLLCLDYKDLMCLQAEIFKSFIYHVPPYSNLNLQDLYRLILKKVKKVNEIYICGNELFRFLGYEYCRRVFKSIGFTRYFDYNEYVSIVNNRTSHKQIIIEVSFDKGGCLPQLQNSLPELQPWSLCLKPPSLKTQVIDRDHNAHSIREIIIAKEGFLSEYGMQALYLPISSFFNKAHTWLQPLSLSREVSAVGLMLDYLLGSQKKVSSKRVYQEEIIERDSTDTLHYFEEVIEGKQEFDPKKPLCSRFCSDQYVHDIFDHFHKLLNVSSSKAIAFAMQACASLLEIRPEESERINKTWNFIKEYISQNCRSLQYKVTFLFCDLSFLEIIAIFSIYKRGLGSTQRLVKVIDDLTDSYYLTIGNMSWESCLDQLFHRKERYSRILPAFKLIFDLNPEVSFNAIPDNELIQFLTWHNANTPDVENEFFYTMAQTLVPRIIYQIENNPNKLIDPEFNPILSVLISMLRPDQALEFFIDLLRFKWDDLEESYQVAQRLVVGKVKYLKSHELEEFGFNLHNAWRTNQELSKKRKYFNLSKSIIQALSNLPGHAECYLGQIEERERKLYHLSKINHLPILFLDLRPSETGNPFILESRDLVTRNVNEEDWPRQIIPETLVKIWEKIERKQDKSNGFLAMVFDTITRVPDLQVIITKLYRFKKFLKEDSDVTFLGIVVKLDRVFNIYQAITEYLKLDRKNYDLFLFFQRFISIFKQTLKLEFEVELCVNKGCHFFLTHYKKLIMTIPDADFLLFWKEIEKFNILLIEVSEKEKMNFIEQWLLEVTPLLFERVIDRFNDQLRIWIEYLIKYKLFKEVLPFLEPRIMPSLLAFISTEKNRIRKACLHDLISFLHAKMSDNAYLGVIINNSDKIVGNPVENAEKIPKLLNKAELSIWSKAFLAGFIDFDEWNKRVPDLFKRCCDSKNVDDLIEFFQLAWNKTDKLKNVLEGLAGQLQKNYFKSKDLSDKELSLSLSLLDYNSNNLHMFTKKIIKLVLDSNKQLLIVKLFNLLNQNKIVILPKLKKEWFLHWGEVIKQHFSFLINETIACLQEFNWSSDFNNSLHQIPNCIQAFENCFEKLLVLKDDKDCVTIWKYFIKVYTSKKVVLKTSIINKAYTFVLKNSALIINSEPEFLLAFLMWFLIEKEPEVLTRKLIQLVKALKDNSRFDYIFGRLGNYFKTSFESHYHLWDLKELKFFDQLPNSEDPLARKQFWELILLAFKNKSKGSLTKLELFNFIKIFISNTQYSLLIDLLPRTETDFDFNHDIKKQINEIILSKIFLCFGRDGFNFQMDELKQVYKQTKLIIKDLKSNELLQDPHKEFFINVGSFSIILSDSLIEDIWDIGIDLHLFYLKYSIRLIKFSSDAFDLLQTHLIKLHGSIRSSPHHLDIATQTFSQLRMKILLTDQQIEFIFEEMCFILENIELLGGISYQNFIKECRSFYETFLCSDIDKSRKNIKKEAFYNFCLHLRLPFFRNKKEDHELQLELLHSYGKRLRQSSMAHCLDEHGLKYAFYCYAKYCKLIPTYLDLILSKPSHQIHQEEFFWQIRKFIKELDKSLWLKPSNNNRPVILFALLSVVRIKDRSNENYLAVIQHSVELLNMLITGLKSISEIPSDSWDSIKNKMNTIILFVLENLPSEQTSIFVPSCLNWIVLLDARKMREEKAMIIALGNDINNHVEKWNLDKFCPIILLINSYLNRAIMELKWYDEIEKELEKTDSYFTESDEEL